MPETQATHAVQSSSDAASMLSHSSSRLPLRARPFEHPRSRLEFLAKLTANLPKSVWAVMDASSVCFGNYVGYQIFHIQFPRSTWVADMTLVNAVAAISFVLAGVVLGLYEEETLRHRARIIVRLILTSVLAIAMAYVVMHALMYEVYSRRIAVIGPIAFLGISGGLRMLACRLLLYLKTRIVFVGLGNSIRRVFQAIHNSTACDRLAAMGYVTVNGQPVDGAPEGLQHLGHVDDIQPICRAYGINEIVIGVEEKNDVEIPQMIMASLRMGCRVTNQPTFHERVFGEVPADDITADWFLFADIGGHRAEQATLKRLFDFGFSLLGLLLTLPLWPVIALAIKFDDGGPVFYTQKRVGRHNRLFTLSKFRTMRVDAEVDGHAWAVPDDPRITRLGKFLRDTHLDELPQLWSILIGDMSIVGPRPERPEFVDTLAEAIPYYDERHLVKPGLTGWAQINYRYGCSVEDSKKKLFLDLYYIKHMSLELDLVIILRTLSTLFVKPG